MADDLPASVLFACNYNRVRSPIAEGLMKLMFGDRVYVESCGLKPADEAPDPFMAAVMDELGVDLGGHQPKTFEDLEEDSFDLVVSLTPEAHHRALELARGRAVEVEYWPTSDPTVAQGARDEVMAAYRELRDRLGARIRQRFGATPTFGG
jgi:protein-tyrosine-phosphatase